MSKLKRNLILNIGYHVISAIIPLLLMPYVARTLGANNLGIYSYTYSVASIFAMLGLLGVANHGNRAIASVRNNIDERSNVFWHVWCVQLVVSLIAVLLYLIYCLLINDNNIKIYFAQCLVVLCSAFDISWYFFGVEKFHITIARNLFIKIVNIILVFTLVKVPGDLLLYSYIISIGLLFNAIILFLFLKKEIVLKSIKLTTLRYHFNAMVILFYPVIAIMIYKVLDKVILGSFSNKVELAYYVCGEKIFMFPGVIITAVGSVMLSRTSALYGADNKEEAEKLFNTSLEIMSYLCIGIAFGIASIAKDFIIVFFGEEYQQASIVMMLSAPIVIFQGWGNVIRTQYLMPKGKDSIYVRAVWLGAISNLLVNLLLISNLGAIGAAISVVVAEFMVLFYQISSIASEIELKNILKRTITFLLPATLMFISIYGVSNICNIPILYKVILEVFVGMIVFLVTSFGYLKKVYIIMNNKK